MQVNVPGIGQVNFPDSMSHDEVVSTIRTKLLPQQNGSNGGLPLSGGDPKMPFPLSFGNQQQPQLPTGPMVSVAAPIAKTIGDVMAAPFVGSMLSPEALRQKLTDQGSDYGTAVHNAAQNTLGMFMAPENFAIGSGIHAGYTALKAAKVSPVLLKSLLGAGGVAMSAPSLGVLVPGVNIAGHQLVNPSGATGPEKVSALPGAIPALLPAAIAVAKFGGEMVGELRGQNLIDKSRPLKILGGETPNISSPRSGAGVPSTPSEPMTSPRGFTAPSAVNKEVPTLAAVPDGVPAGFKEALKAATMPDLQQRYQLAQDSARHFMAQGRPQEANNLATMGQFIREEMQNRGQQDNPGLMKQIADNQGAARKDLVLNPESPLFARPGQRFGNLGAIADDVLKQQLLNQEQNANQGTIPSGAGTETQSVIPEKQAPVPAVASAASAEARPQGVAASAKGGLTREQAMAELDRRAAVAKVPSGFAPATRIGSEVIPGKHGSEQAAYNVARSRNPSAPVERGFVGQNGQFYKTALEAARAVEQQNKQNENRQTSGQVGQSQGQGQQGQTGQGLQGVQARPPLPDVQQAQQGKTAPQGEIPGAVGGAVKRGSGSAGKPQVVSAELPLPKTVKDVEALKAQYASLKESVIKARARLLLDNTPANRQNVKALEQQQKAIETAFHDAMAKAAQPVVDKKAAIDVESAVQPRDRSREGGFFRLFGGADMSALGLKKGTKVQGEQMYNRIKNKLGEGNAAFDYMDKAGLKAFLQTPRTVTEVEKWLGDVAPKVELHSYGMEGKVSEAKKELDALQHNWVDNLSQSKRNRLLSSGMSASQWIRETEMFDPTQQKNANRYFELKKQVAVEPSDTSPRATSHYSSVSAHDPKEVAKHGGDTIRIDWMLPHKPGYQSKAELASGDNWKTDEQLGRRWKSETSIHETAHTLGDTGGWAMGQILTHDYLQAKAPHAIEQLGLKPGEKILHIQEVQDHHIQNNHDGTYSLRMENHSKQYNSWSEANKALVDKYPILKDRQRLTIKAALSHIQELNAKLPEGQKIKRLVVSDAETAMMTERHDAAVTPRRRAIDTGRRGDMGGAIVRYEPTGEPNETTDIPQNEGMRLNYDTILPKIAEELTGSKGERVSLGEHKNAYADKYENYDHLGGQKRVREQRSNLIFRKELARGTQEEMVAQLPKWKEQYPNAEVKQDSNGWHISTPKTDVSGKLYPIEQVDPQKFSLMEKDKGRAVQTVDKTAPVRNRSSEAGAINPQGDIKQRFVGISNRAVRERDIAFAEGLGASPGDAIIKGRQKLAEGVDPHAVLKKFNEDPDRHTSETMVGIAFAHAEDLAIAASEAADKHGIDSPEYKKAQQEDHDWIKSIQGIKTATGRQFTGLQGSVEIDTGTFHGVNRAFMAMTDKPMTESQAKTAQTMVTDANDKATKMAAIQAKFDEFFARQAKEQPAPTTEKVVLKKQGPTSAMVDLPDGRSAKQKANDALRVWKQVREGYLDKGIQDFDDVVNGVATDLGWTPDEVRKTLTASPESKKLSDEMYMAMDARRKAKQSIEFWLKDQMIPGWARVVNMVPRIFFLDKIAGHGTVGMVTHAGLNIFDPNAWQTYWPSFFRQYKMAWSTVNHEAWVQDQLRKPNFAMWKRAGLKHDPYQYPDDYQNASIKAFMGKLNVLVGNYGFDALKDFRINRANQIWNAANAGLKYNEDGKVNLDYAKSIAESVNHATGVVATKLPEGLQTALTTAMFAPKLEFSRWAWAVGDPLKALTIVEKMRNKTATKVEVDFARREFVQKAGIVATYASLLAMNQAYLTATGSKERVNYNNPTKSDFLAFKVAGHTVGVTSAMFGMVRLAARLFCDATDTQKDLKGKSRAGSDDLMRYARGKLSPMAGFMEDIRTQKTATGEVVPWSHDKATAFHPQETPGEYALKTFLPIPFEEAIKEVWDNHGMNADQQATWMKILRGAAVAIPAGGTGARIAPDYSEEQQTTKENKPAFSPPKMPKLGKGIKQFSMNDIIERGGKNYTVVGFDHDGEPMVEKV